MEELINELTLKFVQNSGRTPTHILLTTSQYLLLNEEIWDMRSPFFTTVPLSSITTFRTEFGHLGFIIVKAMGKGVSEVEFPKIVNLE